MSWKQVFTHRFMTLNCILLLERINKSVFFMDFNINICLLRSLQNSLIPIFWNRSDATVLSEKTVRFWFPLNNEQFVFDITWSNIRKLFSAFLSKTMKYLVVLALVLQKNLFLDYWHIFQISGSDVWDFIPSLSFRWKTCSSGFYHTTLGEMFRHYPV